MTVDENKTPLVKTWSPSGTHSERVLELRNHFYSFNDREESNVPYAFTTGYNAFFTQVGSELQEEIITRTEHSL